MSTLLLITRVTIIFEHDAKMKSFLQRISTLGGGDMRLSLGEGGRVASILIDNEKRKNALSGKMMFEFSNIISQLEQMSNVSVVVIKGQGNFFCSGADLSLVAGEGSLGSAKEGAAMCDLMVDLTTRLAELPAISVASISGGVMGGGTEIISACDHRVMHKDAFYQMVQPKMGITPGWGGAMRLTKIIGKSEAIKLLCGAKKISASECLNLKLIDACSEDVKKSVDELIAPYLKVSPLALRSCKRALTSKSVEEEKQIFYSLWGGEENKAAVSKALGGNNKNH